MLRVTRFDPLSGHRLRVGFNDGLVREVDCSFLLHGTLGEPLRDPDYFRRARVDEEARTVPSCPGGLLDPLSRTAGPRYRFRVAAAGWLRSEPLAGRRHREDAQTVEPTTAAPAAPAAR